MSDAWPPRSLERLPPHLMLRHLSELFSEGVEPAPPATPAQVHARRAVMFRSGAVGSAVRAARAFGPFLKRAPLSAAAALADLLIREKAVGRAGLPDPLQALPDDHPYAGFAGLAPDLSTDAIVEGYARGLMLDARLATPVWWAPTRRTLAHPGVVAAALVRDAAHAGLRFSLDANVELCLRGCRRGGLAIDAAVMMALCALYDLGLVHSWEVRDDAGDLRAAGVGLAVGQTFFCVNGFARDAAAGRYGLAHLAAHLERWDYAILDAQALAMVSPALVDRAGFGAADRESFLALLSLHLRGGRTRLHWRADEATSRARAAAPIEAAA